MLKELKVRDWKSFEEASLYIDPLTIMIGANASGKSNILDALLFLQRVSSGIGIFQAINGDLNLAPIRGGMEWVCRKPRSRFTIEATIGGESEKQDFHYTLTVQVNGVKAEVASEELSSLRYSANRKNPKESRLFYTQESAVLTPGIPAYFSTKTQGPGKKIELNRAQIILSQADGLKLKSEVAQGIKYVLAKFQQIFVFDPIPSHMRNYSPLAEQLKADGSNIAGVLAAIEGERKERVETTLTQYLKELPERDIKRVWTEPVGKFGADAMLYCEEGWEGAEDHLVDSRGMSDGTLRYLAIVTAMMIRQPGSLLVVEEVDNGLHPSRARILIDMLKKLGKERSIDVVVTTHNPALLDAAGSRMVPFITVVHRSPESGASILTQLDELEQLPKLLAGGTLGQLSTEGRIETALKKEK